MADIKRLTPPSILLVEDNPLHVRLVTSMLEEVWPGFEDVHQARSLAHAVEYLGEQRPDCILLDLVLPDADGLDAVDTLLAAEPDIPVVVLSSHDDPEMALRAVSQGAEDYLVKGMVDPTELARCIKFAIYRHRSRGPVPPAAREVVEPDGATATGMAMVDADGVVRHATEEIAELFALPLYQLIGASMEDLVHPEDISGWRMAMSGCREHPELGHTVDLRIEDGNGGEVISSAGLLALRGADGDVDAVIVTCSRVAPSENGAGGFVAVTGGAG